MSLVGLCRTYWVCLSLGEGFAQIKHHNALLHLAEAFFIDTCRLQNIDLNMICFYDALNC